MPKRIQRSRAKGWRMPEGAVYVGRPSRWGNPFVTGEMAHVDTCPTSGAKVCLTITRESAVALFRVWATHRSLGRYLWLAPLRGADLACWCPLDQPCHADVLLELANG